MNTYRIHGKVIDHKLGFGIPNLRIDIWDKDPLFDDKISSTGTDEYGTFEINFDETSFRGLFFDRKPDLYFKVFREGKLIVSTKGSVMWNIKIKDIPAKIEVEATPGEVEQYYRETGNLDKPENPMTVALKTMTGHIIAESPEDQKKLEKIQEILASNMMYQDPGEMAGQDFIFEHSDLYASASLSTDRIKKIDQIIADVTAQQKPAKQMVFMRNLPVRSSLIPGFAPAGSNGVKVMTEGPFHDIFDRKIFFDLVNIQELIPLYITGWQYPAIFFKGAYTNLQLQLKRNYEIVPNSFWINAQVLDPAAPEGFFCGLRVRGGTVKTSSVPDDIDGKLTVSNSTEVICELQLEMKGIDNADDLNPFGQDARDAVVTPPLNFKFSFKGNSKFIHDIGPASWNVLGHEAKFKYDGSQDCSYIHFVNRLIIPLPCNNNDFEGQSKSPLCKITGKAKIKNSWWAIPAARININLLPEAEGNGGIAIHCDPGLSVLQANLENKPISLTGPYLLADPGMISLIDLMSNGQGARQQFALWKDDMNPHGTTMEWRFFKGAPYYFISSTEFEVVAGLTHCKLNTDRPVKVDGTSVTIDSRKSLFVLVAGKSTRSVLLIDNDILWDHKLPSENIPHVKPYALALNNALFTVSPPNGAVLFGNCSDDFKEVTHGNLFLAFGLFSYLPTLPDPYAANLGQLTNQFAQAYLRNKTSQVRRINFWLIGLDSWNEAKVDVSFHFAPLANPIIVDTTKKVPKEELKNKEGEYVTNASQDVMAKWKRQNVDVLTRAEEPAQTRSMMYAAVIPPTSQRFPDIFTLLDVSSNASQMGVAMCYLNPIQSRMLKNRDIWYQTLKEAGQEMFPFKVSGMEVQTRGFLAHAFTVPQIAWEPVFNLTEPVYKAGASFKDPLDESITIIAKPAYDPPAGFNYYQDDGVPTRIGNLSPQHVTLAPIPMSKYLVKMFRDNDDRKTYAYFNLPFGMIAMTLLDSSKSAEDGNRPDIAEVRPVFSNELTGGIQIELKAGKSINLDEDQLFEGFTVQLWNINFAGGNPANASTLAHSPDSIFNGEFKPAPDLPPGRPAVPLERIGLSGYGASTFSDWMNKDAIFAQTSQALFNVVTGRTAHEVVQVRSMVYPWGIRVVRSITLFRIGSGYVARIDSGWQSQSDGKFDFSYPVQSVNSSGKTIKVRKNNPFTFHPGTIHGLYKVRNIRETLKSFNVNTTGNYGPWKGDKESNLISEKADFIKKAELLAVTFDCDVELEHVVEGGSANRVVSRGVIGYVQLGPPAVPIDTNAFKALLDFENGSIGGAIDCVIKVAGTNQHMKVNRFDVNNSTDTDKYTPVFVCAARGSVILPKEGSWSIVQHNRGTGEVTPLAEKLSVPLIRSGKLLESNDPLYSSGWGNLVKADDLKKLVRFAHPADLIKTPDTTTINFGFLQNMNTQKVLFLTPSFSPGINSLLSKTPPLLADSFKLMKGNTIFPSIGDAETAFGDAVSLLKGVDESGNTINKVFESGPAGLLDGGKEVLKLLEIKFDEDSTGKLLDQGFNLLKKNINGELNKLIKFDLPDLNYTLVDSTGLKIYIEYKADHKKSDVAGDSNKSYAGKFDFDIDSAAKAWKGKMNNMAIVVDLGPLKRLVTVKGNFNSEKAGDTDFGSKDDLEAGDFSLPRPEVEFSQEIKTALEILELLAKLSAGIKGDYADLIKKGMKIAMSNSANLWEYKFEATKEIPLIKFPPTGEAQAPLKLEASLSLGFYFNAALKVTTDPSQLLPTAGAFIKFHGGLSVMCLTVGAASIYAHGEADLALRADTSPKLSLEMRFGFGVQIAVGLPVVGNASVLFMVGIELYMDTTQKVVVTAFLLFRGEAELLGGLVSVTITIEAKGSVEKLGAGKPANCKAQVTFAIDISIFWVIDISFSESWQETRQIA